MHRASFAPIWICTSGLDHTGIPSAMHSRINASKSACSGLGNWPGLMRTMMPSTALTTLLNAAALSGKYLMTKHAHPCLMTPLAMGMESTRWPCMPLSVPPTPLSCPGMLYSTSRSLNTGAVGCGRMAHKGPVSKGVM